MGSSNSSSLNSSNSSHSLSSKGSSLLLSSSSGQPLPNLSNSSSGLHLSSSLLQDHSGPLQTSRTHMWAISRFTSRTLPFSSSNSAPSRDKPSVSSRPTPLPLVLPSRLHLSPSSSASSQ